MLRGRFLLHRKTLATSLGLLGVGLLGTFIFYDGPFPTLPSFEASAQATETTETPISLPQAYQFNPSALSLPSGFTAQWKKISLDRGQMALNILDKPFQLKQTHNGLGSEYYDYAALLFEQMGAGIQDPQLAQRFQELSLQAQTLGNSLRQAGDLAYDSPDTHGMKHLQVRANIQFHLSGIKPNAMRSLQYDQNGRLLKEEASTNQQTGENLTAFLATAQSILEDPAAKQYPETLQVLKKQRDLLENLSEHISLRWESTLYCRDACGNGDNNNAVTTRTRIYIRQTLPEQMITATI